MHKKLVALFAAFSMTAGLAVSAYAADAAITLNNVSDANSDTEKRIEVYAEGLPCDGIYDYSGKIVVSSSDITMAYEVPSAWPSTPKYDLQFNAEKGTIVLTGEDDDFKVTNGYIGTIVLTAESFKDLGDVTVSLNNVNITGNDEKTYKGSNSILIESKSTPTDVEPDVSYENTKLDFTAEVNDGSVADIYKSVVTANDYTTGSISGLTVSVNGIDKVVNTTLSAGANVTIAVIIGYAGGTSEGYEPAFTAIVE